MNVTSKVTGEEKAELLAEVGNESNKNGGSCKISRDEFINATGIGFLIQKH